MGIFKDDKPINTGTFDDDTIKPTNTVTFVDAAMGQRNLDEEMWCPRQQPNTGDSCNDYAPDRSCTYSHEQSICVCQNDLPFGKCS